MKLYKTLRATILLLVSCLMGQNSAIAQDKPVASSVEVIVLSSNLASGSTVGEWGFSALARVDGECLLFDAGFHPDTVLRNIEVLNVNLSCVTDIVLSHFHHDHIGGLKALIDQTRDKNPAAMRRIHVAQGFFRSRRVNGEDTEWNQMIEIRNELQSKGVEFRIHDGPTEILPSVWATGPVKRTHNEKTYPTFVEMQVDGEWVTDYVPDSQGLTIVTDEGPIVLLGCGHSGSVNLLEQVRRDIQDQPIHALMGGMHLFSATNETLDWTTKKLVNIGVQNLMAGHCTGVEPMFRLRHGLSLTRKTAVIGAVGSRFVLGEGIHPTVIAQ